MIFREYGQYISSPEKKDRKQNIMRSSGYPLSTNLLHKTPSNKLHILPHPFRWPFLGRKPNNFSKKGIWLKPDLSSLSNHSSSSSDWNDGIRALDETSAEIVKQPLIKIIHPIISRREQKPACYIVFLSQIRLFFTSLVQGKNIPGELL